MNLTFINPKLVRGFWPDFFAQIQDFSRFKKILLKNCCFHLAKYTSVKLNFPDFSRIFPGSKSFCILNYFELCMWIYSASVFSVFSVFEFISSWLLSIDSICKRPKVPVTKKNLLTVWPILTSTPPLPIGMLHSRKC